MQNVYLLKLMYFDPALSNPILTPVARKELAKSIDASMSLEALGLTEAQQKEIQQKLLPGCSVCVCFKLECQGCVGRLREALYFMETTTLIYKVVDGYGLPAGQVWELLRPAPTQVPGLPASQL